MRLPSSILNAFRGLPPSRSPLAIALAALMLAGAIAPAQARPRMDPVLDQAVTEFIAAQNGDEALIKKSSQTLDAIYARPERMRDPLVMVFAGAAKARMAQTTMLPWSKISYAEDGLALADKALQRIDAQSDAADPGFTPQGKEVRFVAANLFLAVPAAIFHRDAQGNRLLDDLLATVDTDATPADFKAAVHVLAGQRAAKAGDKALARRHFEKAISYGSPQETADAQRELKALGT